MQGDLSKHRFYFLVVNVFKKGIDIAYVEAMPRYGTKVEAQFEKMIGAASKLRKP